jgi:hypothetical protein
MFTLHLPPGDLVETSMAIFCRSLFMNASSSIIPLSRNDEFPAFLDRMEECGAGPAVLDRMEECGAGPAVLDRMEQAPNRLGNTGKIAIEGRHPRTTYSEHCPRTGVPTVIGDDSSL